MTACYPFEMMMKSYRGLALLGLMLLLSACGGETDSAAPAEDAAAVEERQAAMLAHMQAHFDSFYAMPPEVVEALERGELTQEAVDARAAAGEFGKFFQFKTAADIPADLLWENGLDLPELGSPDAKKGGTYYGSLADFPRTLRLFGPDSNGSFRPWILDDTRMGFGRRHPNDTSIDANGNFRYFPGIAEAWAMDKANRTVYVRINPAARFSDGEAITADDMMFSFYFWHQPFIQAPFMNNFFTRNYVNITRYDEHTFSVTLPEAKPDMLGRALALEPMPMHFFAEFGEDYVERYQWEFVPTSGPYVIEPDDLKKGRSVTLTRNADWWAKDLKFWRHRFNTDRIRLEVIRDTAKRFEAFRKGELSMFGLALPEYFYEKLPATDPLVEGGYVKRSVFYNQIPRPTYGLWINSGRPLLDNQDIRVGINYATNWDKVIAEYFRGDYSRMRTTADGYGEFTHPTLTARPFDVEAALDRFAQAGFRERGPDGVLVNDAGERLSFTLSTGYESLKDTLTILREEALKAGLEFRLEVLDGTASWKKVQEKQHDIHFSAFNVSPEMYPRYWETYHSVNAWDVPWLADGSPNPARKLKSQTNNLQSIALRELDERIEAYRASDDVEEMRRLAFEMEEILHDDGSFVPGFVIPFMRGAYWRWVNWPEDYNVKLATSLTEYFLFWIDDAEREATLDGRKRGETFPKVDNVFDQYSSITMGQAE
ncbi:MAG: extracellular solute-binding protein [Pseudomonadota bacterium]